MKLGQSWGNPPQCFQPLKICVDTAFMSESGEEPDVREDCGESVIRARRMLGEYL